MLGLTRGREERFGVSDFGLRCGAHLAATNLFVHVRCKWPALLPEVAVEVLLFVVVKVAVSASVSWRPTTNSLLALCASSCFARMERLMREWKGLMKCLAGNESGDTCLGRNARGQSPTYHVVVLPESSSKYQVGCLCHGSSGPADLLPHHFCVSATWQVFLEDRWQLVRGQKFEESLLFSQPGGLWKVDFSKDQLIIVFCIFLLLVLILCSPSACVGGECTLPFCGSCGSVRWC